METPAHWPANWLNYLGQLPEPARLRLIEVLMLVEATVPEAVKDWSYQMPAFKYKGKPLVYAAGYAQHTGLYALPNTHAAFAEALQAYKQGKGSVQFPHNKPLPLHLIREMVVQRLAQL